MMQRALPIILLLSSFAGMAGADIVEQAAAAMCKCGVPPRSACVDQVAVTFPRLNNDPDLQDQVMQRYQDDCVRGMGARVKKDNTTAGAATIPGAAATGIDGVVSSTADCSTALFSVDVPSGWSCRKQKGDAQDVTLHAYGNTLNVSLGVNQGMTSCSVIPICTSEDYKLSGQFVSKRFTNPMAPTEEYAGHYKQDGSFKLTVTSNNRLTPAQFLEIEAILDSFAAK